MAGTRPRACRPVGGRRALGILPQVATRLLDGSFCFIRKARVDLADFFGKESCGSYVHDVSGSALVVKDDLPNSVVGVRTNVEFFVIKQTVALEDF